MSNKKEKCKYCEKDSEIIHYYAYSQGEIKTEYLCKQHILFGTRPYYRVPKLTKPILTSVL